MDEKCRVCYKCARLVSFRFSSKNEKGCVFVGEAPKLVTSDENIVPLGPINQD